MKKLLLILCLLLLVTGCSEKNIESSTLEIISESTTELQTETSTESETEVPTEYVTEQPTTVSNIYTKQTYRELLENIYYNREFPDWDYKNYDKDVSIDFAVYDIDSDGRDELLVTFDHRAIYLYDHNADGNLVQQISGYIQSDFYENGAVRVYSAHNQTHSVKVSPFAMYKYNSETDSYDECGNVCGIDKGVINRINQQIEEAGETDFYDYPAEYDTSNSGTVVYYISPDRSDKAEPLDVTEYNEYYEQFTEGTGIIDIPFMKLTEENIENVNV